MHILLVTGEYPPAEGGVGAYTSELASALVARDLRVSVVTTAVAGDDSAQVAALPVLAGEKTEVAVYRSIDKWTWRMPASIAALAADVNADWIHVQYQTAAYSMHPAINFAPGRWRMEHAVAWTYHDLLVPYLFPKAGATIRRWVTERPAGRADLVVVTNEGDRSELATRNVKNLYSIPIGSNIRSVTLSADERVRRRAHYGFGPDTMLLAYFGFLNRSKGGLTLIRTLERLVKDYPDVRLLMIGERVGASDPTNYAYLQEVETLIKDANLTDRIVWTGHQPDENVAADLNACDVLVMPYEDGASLRRGTLMAGLANGCAIVTTTPQSPLPELVTERDLIYAAPGNDQAMAKMIARLFDNAWLADKLRTNARERSRLFTWDSIAQRHVELYQGTTSG